ncbi:VWA domain-containing protein [Roseiflexus sp.]|uniref:VWA domain-containing protein n=1 Tax=Roseiflexus sp. TaxID=2562120 RepID=UPI00398A9D06
MKHLCILCIALSLVLPASLAVAQSQDRCSGLNVHSVSFQFPKVEIVFSICDDTGNRIVGLDRSAIRLTEDSKPVSSFTMETAVADAQTPTQTVVFPNGMLTLTATGASIGIVFDATQLLNGSGQQRRDSIAEGRAAIEAFLLESGDPPPPRTRAPGNIERVGLFIPADQPNQSLRPASLPDFTQDRYAVVNTLRQDLPYRQGKTSLIAAIQAAIDATARDAQQRGAEAVVLVVSDGGDTLTGDTFDGLIAQASQQKVKIVAFGVGTDRALQSNGFRLKQLAEVTGGLYIERPSVSDAGNAFMRVVYPRSNAVYLVGYNTSIIDDGKQHPVVLEVTTPSGVRNYSFSLAYEGIADNTQLAPLGDVLLRRYFIFAIPIALLFSLFLTLISGAMFWFDKSSSGGLGGKTKR